MGFTRCTAVAIALLSVTVACSANDAVLTGSSHATRRLHAIKTAAHELAAACPEAAAHNCALAQSMCMQHVPHGDQGSICSCFQHLGICLHNAGCLNGANENLQTKYCETGDSYCCNNRGEFNGCGTRWPFTGREMCRCEELYSGIFCNTTSANCATGASCTVCSACCKGYTQDTCNECVSHECDRNVCNAGASCTACPACCKSYLEGHQADCNICVETECGASR